MLRDGLADVLESGAQRVLEREVLPAYLAKRRWFAAKDQKHRSGAHRLHCAALPGGDARAAAGRDRGQRPDGAHQR